ncbi:MAG: biopolymer transporter ExbD, partial [Candidatus Omnitrophota bacterium]
VIQKENLILVMTSDNKVFLNERPLTSEELLSRVKIAAKEEKPILIKSDRDVPLGDVVKIWDLCRREGVRKINIATTQEGK